MSTEHSFESDVWIESVGETVGLLITYEYEPHEPMRTDSPEWPESIDVINIKLNGNSVAEWLKTFTRKEMEEIENLCWVDTEKRLSPDI